MGLELSKQESRRTQFRSSKSSRRRSSVDSDIAYISSGLTKPIGVSSATNSSVSSSQPVTGSKSVPAEIVVVRGGITDPQEDVISFPPVFKPLIPIGHETLSLAHPQLNSQFVTDLGLIVEETLRSKADIINKEQLKLVERVKEVDSSSNYVTSSFNEELRRFNKIEESFGRVNEINTLIERCERDLIKSLRSLEVLNNRLSPTLRLEPINN